MGRRQAGADGRAGSDMTRPGHIAGGRGAGPGGSGYNHYNHPHPSPHTSGRSARIARSIHAQYIRNTARLMVKWAPILCKLLEPRAPGAKE